jgi:hypothetical protein
MPIFSATVEMLSKTRAALARTPLAVMAGTKDGGAREILHGLKAVQDDALLRRVIAGEGARVTK